MSAAGVSPPRIYVRGATLALTRRTTMRKAFLAPWHPLVEQLRLWFLAKAQVATGVAIHAAHDVVTHHHTRITTASADALPEFLRITHGETSRALNTLLAHERYDAPGEIFDDRQTHVLRLLDPEAQASHHVYEHLNTTAAGLVARPEHMPGVKLSHDRWKSRLVVVKRPPIYVDARTNPAELPLVLTPDPELYAAFDGDLEALVYHLDRMVDHGLRRIRDARRGRRPLGAKGVRRIHPWSEPRTLREPRGQPVPTFKVGARDLLGLERERRGAAETSRWRREHRDTRLARRDGDLERAYPYGTYAARVYQGAPVEAVPAADALLAAPGRTLEEVEATLGARRADEAEARRAARRRLVQEVKDAWTEEAADVVAHDDLELCRKVAMDAGDGQGPARDGVEVRHRFERRPTERSRAAQIVTLRDRRRDRPRRSDKPGGADPPK